MVVASVNREAGSTSSQGRRRRWLARWWRQLSPADQDRWAAFAPLGSVLLFLVALAAAFGYLRVEERELQADAVRSDATLAQQALRLRLIDQQDQLARMARELAGRELDAAGFAAAASAFAATRPEVRRVTAFGGEQQLRSMFDPMGTEAPGGFWPSVSWHAEPGVRASETAALRRADPEPGPQAWAFIAARDLRQPMYTQPFRDARGDWVFQVHVPMLLAGRFVGTLSADVSVDALMRQQVPGDVLRRRTVSVIDAQGEVVATTAPRAEAQGTGARAPTAMPLHVDAPLAPAMNGLVLRVATDWRGSPGLVSNALLWMVVALSGLTAWMLIGTWRHMRRRTEMQTALLQETSFRRAMEDSMLTGMRAIDLEGRVTYVNPAFCAMTGYSEVELLDRLPPYPYWPADRLEENRLLLEQQLQGRSPSGGVEIRVMRKDGSQFDGRMYVSALIDAKGHQTGWVASMTNITEAKRVRDQLSASHERFTTVLEGLEAAVSVLSVQQGELLFANRSYRLWFGVDARGHGWLADGDPSVVRTQPYRPGDDDVDAYGGLPAQQLEGLGATPREVYVEALDKWFDVRARYLQWTDGSLAQMLIATDVTARKQADELAATQAEKAQVSSRLITMGEMASSVAHELNQPLTAITNYCNGMLSRLKANRIDRDALAFALDKTARQAERAGQIIHRIRAFVKKSEPQRVVARAVDIVEDAVELASFELRRRQVQIHQRLARDLPPLLCDPILIEQVLLNLLKNAAEAIDMARMPPARRHLELRVASRRSADEGEVIEFSVADRGPGLPPEVLARLYESFFSTKPHGLGIGLSLCRSIVESHRGRMTGENLYNGDVVVGCRFAFTLPVDAAVAAQVGTADPQGARDEPVPDAAAAASADDLADAAWSGIPLKSPFAASPSQPSPNPRAPAARP